MTAADRRIFKEMEGVIGRAGGMEAVPAPLPGELISTTLLLAAARALHGCALPASPEARTAAARQAGVCWTSEPEVLALLESIFEQVCSLTGKSIRQSLPRPQRQYVYPALAIVQACEQTTIWRTPGRLGDLLQLLALPERRLALKDIQSADKALTAQGLADFTRLYTPSWVVQFLVENTLIPLWREFDRSSCRFPYALAVTRPAMGRPAEQLTVIDPASGSGHFILYAADVLASLYESEGVPRAESIPIILQSQVAAADIDARSLFCLALGLYVLASTAGARLTDLTGSLAHTLTGEAGAAGEHSLLGSLSRHYDLAPGHPLSRRYSAVLTNPPYLGRRLLDRRLKGELKRDYPLSHQDLCAAFVQRGIELSESGGRMGLIGQASLLVLPSYRDLRRQIIDHHLLVAAVEAGTGVFPTQTGEKINSVLLVLEKLTGESRRPPDNHECLFVDLSGEQEKAEALIELSEKAEGECVYRARQSAFRTGRASVFDYKRPGFLPDTSSWQRLSDMAEARQGLATSDNKRFVRNWWQVDRTEIGRRWRPYVKGAGVRRWYSPIEHVVDWGDSGESIKDAVARAYPYLKGKTGWVVKNEAYYFQAGLTFSFIGSGNFAARTMPAGCIFDVSGSAIFPYEDESADVLLAYLNSSLASVLMRTLNPTINFQVGDIKAIPVPPFASSSRGELAALAQECVRLKRELYAWDISSLDFVMPEVLSEPAPHLDFESLAGQVAARHTLIERELAVREQAINRLVCLAANPEPAAARRLHAAADKWLDARERRRQRAEAPAIDPAEFARLIVYLSILRLTDDRSCGPSATSCAAPPAYARRPVVLSLAEPPRLLNELGWSEQQAGWLEQMLSAPLGGYLHRQFPGWLARRFAGKTPIYLKRFGECGPAVVVDAYSMESGQWDESSLYQLSLTRS